jgi:hypothetical protein
VTEIVPATREMWESFYGSPPTRTMRAFAGLSDGQVLAMFGVYYGQNHMVLFSDMKPEARAFKKTIVKAAKNLAETIKSKGIPVFACADKTEGAVRLLEHIGFKHVVDNYYEWRA